jgi:hypothetical protein
MLLLSLSLSKTAQGAHWNRRPQSPWPRLSTMPVVLGKKHRLVTVQDYPGKFVSQQLLDYKGTEIMYPVEDDRDRWWARRLEDAVNHHRNLAERDLDDFQAYSFDVFKPSLSMLCGGCSRRWKRRSVVSVLRERSIIIAAPEAVLPQIMRIYARKNYIYA